MTRSVTVTRDLLSLSTLELWTPPTSIVVGDSFGPGPDTLRRETETSPYMRGRILTGFVEDSRDAQLLLELGATSGAGLTSAVGVVKAAFRQMTYTLAWNFDGVASSYTCEPADIVVGNGGVLEDIDIAFHAVRVLLTIPHHPIPLTGQI